MAKIKTIGILTSGGDAPGMNACIRAVTRTAIFNGMTVYGIYRGFEGLIGGELEELTTEKVSNTIQRGGTILKTARSTEFRTPEGRQKAYDQLKAHGIDALIVIGGNGSLSGAQEFASEHDIPVIGLPGTIDNDLCGTDSTIGYDTALNTIVDCVDKIRDTASSHERIFFVEVMGRDAGFLAQNSAIASGAEAAIIPEDQTDVDQLAQFISRGMCSRSTWPSIWQGTCAASRAWRNGVSRLPVPATTNRSRPWCRLAMAENISGRSNAFFTFSCRPMNPTTRSSASMPR